MSSHVVCPLCGKSSPIRSFPAGDGKDILLQTFRGLGRGKGFEVIDRSSGLDDRNLCGAVKPKLLSLLNVFVDHGHVLPAEVTALAGGDVPPTSDQGRPPAMDAELAALVSEVAVERSRRQRLEAEVRAMESEITEAHRDHARADRYVREQAHRLAAAQGLHGRLARASRGAVENLKRLRPQLDGNAASRELFAEQVRALRSIVELVQEATDVSGPKAEGTKPAG